MLRRLPAATSRPIPRPRTTRSKRAGGTSLAMWTICPRRSALDEIDKKVDLKRLEETLMDAKG